jgi:prevent-host-death family protein
MRTVNIHEAKTHLSRLIEQAVTQGEPFVIARAGKPLVKVTPLETGEASSRPRRIGFLKGYNFPDDIKAIAREEIIKLFEGGDEP